MSKVNALRFFLSMGLLLMGCVKAPGVDSSSSMMASFKHSTELQTCIACHASDRPIGKVGPYDFDHAAFGALGDCVSCHGVAKEKIGVTWNLQ